MASDQYVTRAEFLEAIGILKTELSERRERDLQRLYDKLDELREILQKQVHLCAGQMERNAYLLKPVEAHGARLDELEDQMTVVLAQSNETMAMTETNSNRLVALEAQAHKVRGIMLALGALWAVAVAVGGFVAAWRDHG